LKKSNKKNQIILKPAIFFAGFFVLIINGYYRRSGNRKSFCCNDRYFHEAFLALSVTVSNSGQALEKIQSIVNDGPNLRWASLFNCP